MTNEADLKDVRSAIETLETGLKEAREDQKRTNEIVVKLLGGFESKVIPMIDSHQQILESLPKQLEDSFTKQTENMKGYIERRLNPVDEKGVPSTTTPQKGSTGFDFNRVLDWADKRIQESGGLGNLLKGNSGGVDGEINLLEKEYLNRAKLNFRDLLREALQLPVPSKAPVASAPVKVAAP